MSVEQFMKRTKARRADNTVKNRRVALRQYQEYLADLEIKLTEVEPYHIEDWIDSLLLDEYAPRTIREKVYCVSAYYEFAKNRGLVDENPVEPVDLSDYSDTKINDETEVRYIDPEQYEKMLENANLRDEVLLRLLWDTGVRASEVIKITESDIERDEREIAIETAKSRKLKSNKTRSLHYSRRTEATLREWLDEGGRDSYLGVGDDDDEGHVLVTKQQPKMAVGRVTEIVDERAEDAGIQEEVYEDQAGRSRRRVTAHTLRHSYAVHRVKNGMPLVYLQVLLGHSDIDITRKYLHFRDDDIKDSEARYRP
jgi:integrase/recombinase XerD